MHDHDSDSANLIGQTLHGVDRPDDIWCCSTASVTGHRNKWVFWAEKLLWDDARVHTCHCGGRR
jgi:hypothetical protein